jgi:hypothetical protein
LSRDTVATLDGIKEKPVNSAVGKQWKKTESHLRVFKRNNINRIFEDEPASRKFSKLISICPSTACKAVDHIKKLLQQDLSVTAKREMHKIDTMYTGADEVEIMLAGTRSDGLHGCMAPLK